MANYYSRNGVRGYCPFAALQKGGDIARAVGSNLGPRPDARTILSGDDRDLGVERDRLGGRSRPEQQPPLFRAIQIWPRTGCAFHRQGGSAPNGTIQDTTEYWSAGKAYYDPAKITAPTLLVLAEWDNDTPPYMAQTLFPLLVNSPGKRLVILAEGAHGIIMEKNRLKLFEAVISFLDEAGRS